MLPLQWHTAVRSCIVQGLRSHLVLRFMELLENLAVVLNGASKAHVVGGNNSVELCS